MIQSFWHLFTGYKKATSSHAESLELKGLKRYEFDWWTIRKKNINFMIASKALQSTAKYSDGNQ